MIAKVHRIS